MRKKIISLGLLGFPLGVFLGYTITIFISAVDARGVYLPVVPELTKAMGSEISAVVLQYFLSGILGVGFAASSVIWQNENWSILKRTVLHLIAMSVFLFPIAYITYWMPHTPWGIAQYLLIFLTMYVIIAAIQYFAYQRNVRAINQKLQNR